jgi:predicted MPP superfamily phosphohydrolase
VTGDLTLRREWEGEYVADLARQLSQMAPVYFVCGNHEAACRDLPALLQALADNGVRVLHPSGREALVRPGGSIRVAGTGGSIMMAGIADPRFHAREPAQWGANLAGLRGGVDGDPYTVLLSHRPERFAEYTQAGFDLVLAGHAHGGQIRLPGIGGLYAPDQGFLPRYSCGCSQAGRTAMVVSRGLGDSGPFLRLFNPPELVMVRLVALDAGQPPWAAIPGTFAVHPGRG